MNGDYNITGITDWRIAHFVPRCEPFKLSLVSAYMAQLCNLGLSAIKDDFVLGDALTFGRRRRGFVKLHCEITVTIKGCRPFGK